MQDISICKNISLSNYFPKGTYYFYGYPTGDDSGFINQVPPVVEEIVSARPNICAGPNVNVISFAAASKPAVPSSVLKGFGVVQPAGHKVTLLPDNITPSIHGERRNQEIRQALLNLPFTHNLIMAQPYLGKDIEKIYQISPQITAWLNDKQNLQSLFSDDVLPKRLCNFKNGKEFASKYLNVALPVVVKASSSSSGDGVYICKDSDDLKQAINELATVQSSVIIEQYIDERKNYGLHFAIPSDQSQPINIIGINEQLTTDEGEFIGGIINTTKIPQNLQSLGRYILSEVLPKVRKMGWYGVGNFDILVDDSDSCYIVDSNFRMTGMTAYHFMIANNTVKAPIMGFMGHFTGDQYALLNKLDKYAGQDGKPKFMQIIAINYHDNIWRFNAALEFLDPNDLREKCRLLIELGVNSDALKQLAAN